MNVDWLGGGRNSDWFGRCKNVGGWIAELVELYTESLTCSKEDCEGVLVNALLECTLLLAMFLLDDGFRALSLNTPGLY